jgi:hypothetical protein
MYAMGEIIVNEKEEILVKIRKLETAGLLKSPPENTTEDIKFEITLTKNSSGLELYIEDTRKFNQYCKRAFYFSLAILISIFISMLRKNKNLRG